MYDPRRFQDSSHLWGHDESRRKATFVYSYKSLGFGIESHGRELTSAGLSIEEAREFLAEIEAQMTQYYKSSWCSLDTLLSPLLVAACGKALIVILCLCLVIFAKISNNQFLLIFGVYFAVYILAIILAYIYQEARIKHAYRLIANVHAYIERTASHYQSRGLVWNMSLDFCIIDKAGSPELNNTIELWQYSNSKVRSSKRNQAHIGRSRDPARLAFGFPYDFKSQKFISHHYFPLKTNNKLSSEEARQFLSQIERSLSRYYKHISTCFLVCLVLVLLWFVQLVVNGMIKDLEASPEVQILVLIADVFYCIYSFSCLVIAYICVIKAKKKRRDILTSAQAYIEQTASQFSRRGLRWVLSKDFTKSIELWKDELPEPSPIQDHQGQLGQLPSSVQNAEMFNVIAGDAHEDDITTQSIRTQDNIPLIVQDTQANSLASAGPIDKQEGDIVFPYDGDLKRFMSHHFFPGRVDHKMSTEEVNKVLEEEVKPYRNLYDRSSFQKLFWSLLKVLSVWTSLVFISVTYTIDQGVIFRAIWFGSWAIAFFIFWVIGITYDSKAQKDKLQIGHKIKRYFEQRGTEDAQRGLQWITLPDFPDSITLRYSRR